MARRKERPSRTRDSTIFLDVLSFILFIDVLFFLLYSFFSTLRREVGKESLVKERGEILGITS